MELMSFAGANDIWTILTPSLSRVPRWGFLFFSFQVGLLMGRSSSSDWASIIAYGKTRCHDGGEERIRYRDEKDDVKRTMLKVEVCMKQLDQQLERPCSRVSLFPHFRGISVRKELSAVNVPDIRTSHIVPSLLATVLLHS